MSIMKALVMDGTDSAKVVSDRPLPKPRTNYLGVKVTAVALNPTDWKHIRYMNTSNLLCGCDFAGTVETVGEGYNTKWKVGDRICGVAQGGNSLQPEDGAFAEHVMAMGDLCLPIPDHMSDEEAATLPLGAMTCGQGLYQELKLAPPDSPTKSPEIVLIYGGSTATGALGIQLLKLSGYTVVTTCSPRNFNYVKSLGADAVFDYNDKTCAEQIKKFANNKLMYAWDTYAEDPAPTICEDALAPGGKYAALLEGEDYTRDDISHTWTLLYTVFGEPVDKVFFKTEALPDHYEFGVKWTNTLSKLIKKHKIKVHRPKEMDGGLGGIMEGLGILKEGKISGEKLVYKL